MGHQMTSFYAEVNRCKSCLYYGEEYAKGWHTCKYKGRTKVGEEEQVDSGITIVTLKKCLSKKTITTNRR